jgi:AcrR family transcriptional regulator
VAVDRSAGGRTRSRQLAAEVDKAALELFLEHGYENVTVAQITERAGLTRRSFSRYFTDKRDVLFTGSERLPAVLARSVRDADSTLGHRIWKQARYQTGAA